jgi:hypothetical protein
MLPNTEAELTLHYIAHLIQVDDAKRHDELPPFWTKTDEAEKQFYLNLARQRLTNWRKREEA